MKRPLVQMLREEHGFSERRACEAVGRRGRWRAMSAGLTGTKK